MNDASELLKVVKNKYPELLINEGDRKAIKKTKEYKSIRIQSCTYDRGIGGIVLFTNIEVGKSDEDSLLRALIVFHTEIEKRLGGIEFQAGGGSLCGRMDPHYVFRCFSTITQCKKPPPMTLQYETSPATRNLDALKLLRKLNDGALNGLTLEHCRFPFSGICRAMRFNSFFSNVRFEGFKMIWDNVEPGADEKSSFERKASIGNTGLALRYFFENSRLNTLQRYYRAKDRKTEEVNENRRHGEDMINRINQLKEKIKDIRVTIRPEREYGDAISFTLLSEQLNQDDLCLFGAFLREFLYSRDCIDIDGVYSYKEIEAQKGVSWVNLRLHGLTRKIEKDGRDDMSAEIIDGKGPEYICNVIHLVEKLSNVYPSLGKENVVSELNDRVLGRLGNDIPYQFVSEDGKLKVKEKLPRTVAMDVKQSENPSEKKAVLSRFA